MNNRYTSRINRIKSQLSTTSSFKGMTSPEKSIQSRPPITTHILDTSLGRPAHNVDVDLFYSSTTTSSESKEPEMVLQKIGGGVTNSDGRIPDLLSADYVS